MSLAEKRIFAWASKLPKCKETNVPLVSGNSTHHDSSINSAMVYWLSKQQTFKNIKRKSNTKRQLGAPKSGPKPESLLVADFFYPENMADYSLDDLRYGPPKAYVPKELNILLDGYAANPRKYIESKLSGRDLLEVGSDTPLGIYLQSVMNGNDAINKLYNIDFYNNNDTNGTNDGIPNYLAPYELAYLFFLVRRTGRLNTDQWQFLGDALKAMSFMDITDLMDFLDVYYENNFLTPRVCQVINEFVQTIELKPEQKKRLMFGFDAAQHSQYTFTTKNQRPGKPTGAVDDSSFDFDETILNDDINVDKKNWPSAEGNAPGREGLNAAAPAAAPAAGPAAGSAAGTAAGPAALHVVFDERGFDAQGYNVEGYDHHGFNRYGYDKQGFVRHSTADRHILHDIKVQMLKRYKKRVESFIQRMHDPAPTPSQVRDGFYEPWDASINWSTTRILIDKARSWRKDRLDWKRFHYNRGLEKYIADLEQTQEMLGKLENDIEAAIPVRRSQKTIAADKTVIRRNRDANLTLGRQKHHLKLSTSA